MVDLGEVPILCRRGVLALHDLHRQADTRGVRLHITGDGSWYRTVESPLHRAGLDGVLDPAVSADTLIGLLALRRPVRGG